MRHHYNFLQELYNLELKFLDYKTMLPLLIVIIILVKTADATKNLNKLKITIKLL